MAPDLLPVLGNRSACYLQLGELVRCIEDCDQLMQRLDEESMHANANPNDPVKLAMRLKALARRGTALICPGQVRSRDSSRDVGRRLPCHALRGVGAVE